MLGFNIRSQVNTKPVEEAERKAAFENIGHAGRSLGKKAKSLIKRRKAASSPGQPPNTRGRGGHNLRGAIFASIKKDSAMIGPRHSFVGESGRAHEFGEDYEGDSFDKRSFMEPALDASRERFLDGWSGSIGE